MNWSRNLVGAIALSLISAMPVYAADMTLRVGSSNSPDSALGRGLNHIAELVEKANVGLKLQIFPSGQLGAPEAQVDIIWLFALWIVFAPEIKFVAEVYVIAYPDPAFVSIYIKATPPEGVPFVRTLSEVVPTLTDVPVIPAQFAPEVPVQNDKLSCTFALADITFTVSTAIAP